MKRVGIITIFDNKNLGNRLQNYALQEELKKLNVMPMTFKNTVGCNIKSENFTDRIKIVISYIKKTIKNILYYIFNYKRFKNFQKFNKDIIINKKQIDGNRAKKIEKKFDFFIAGSDQIWNYKFRKLSYIDTLQFTRYDKRVSYAASFS